jgi:aspartyl aminopeptidase
MRNPATDSLIAFLNASPTPWHAAAETARQLEAAGASRLREDEPWTLRPGHTGFVVRGGGTIAALRVPDGFSLRKPLPFHIVAAHTDSPGLRLKPRPPTSSHEYRQWGVEVYGGVLHNSWLDRDLGIAGRVFVPSSRDAILVRREDKPVRIPQLAIHLDRTVNEQGLILNAEKHLVPILGQVGGESLESMLENWRAILRVCPSIARCQLGRCWPVRRCRARICPWFPASGPRRQGALPRASF